MLKSVPVMSNLEKIDRLLVAWRPYILSLLRIITAYLFMAHGTQKLFGYPTTDEFAGIGLISWFGLTGVLETFGGLAVLLGVFTRPIAFVLSLEMAVVYLVAHASEHILPNFNGGDLWFLYCFIFLYLAVAGGGPWSVDGKWRGVGEPVGYFADWEPQLLSVLRITMLLVFIPHGTEDMIGWPWPAGEEAFGGPDYSRFQTYGHLIEIIAAPFLLLGLLTRPLALLFSGEMAIAYFYSHQPRTFWPILNLGVDVILFCFVFLYFAAAGGGPWVLDRFYCRQTSARE